jgi:hypothetical protein
MQTGATERLVDCAIAPNDKAWPQKFVISTVYLVHALPDFTTVILTSAMSKRYFDGGGGEMSGDRL